MSGATAGLVQRDSVPFRFRKVNISAIAQGLLASGHFTEIANREDVDDKEQEPRVRRWDAGKDWKDDDHAPRRFPSFVVAEAVSIYEDILFEWRQEQAGDFRDTLEANGLSLPSSLRRATLRRDEEA
jgi:hypothetical protein